MKKFKLLLKSSDNIIMNKKIENKYTLFSQNKYTVRLLLTQKVILFQLKINLQI